MKASSKKIRTASMAWAGQLIVFVAVMSDFKWRRRSRLATLEGAVDWAIMLELAVYGLLALVLATQSLGIGRMRPGRQRALKLLWLYSGYMFVTTAWSEVPALSAVRASQLLVLAMAAQVLGSSDATDFHQAFRRTFVLVSSAVLALAFVLPNPNLDRAGLTVPWLHPGWTGLYLGLGVLICVWFAWVRDPVGSTRSTRLWYLLAGALGVGAIATLTRSVMGAIVLGLWVMWLTFPHSPRPRSRRLVLVATGFVVLVAVALNSTQVGTFLARDQDAAALASLSDRTKIFSAAWEHVLDSPIVGHGFIASRSIFLGDSDIGFTVDSAHNDLLEALLSGGFVGLGMLVALLGAVVFAAHRFTRNDMPSEIRAEASLILGTITMLLVVGAMFEGIAQGSNAMSIWLAMAIAWVTGVERKVLSIGSSSVAGTA